MTASGTAEARVAGDALTFERSGRRILTDITFRVKAGRITGLLGTNGAGKSYQAYPRAHKTHGRNAHGFRGSAGRGAAKNRVFA